MRIIPGVLLLACGAFAATEISIKPDPAGKPVIAAAIEAVGNGGTVRLSKGVYREYVDITRPVTLFAGEGVVIDPSEPLATDWRPAPEIGKGVYKTASQRRPYTLFIDGKVLAQVDPKRADSGPWFWKNLLAVGPQRTGFRFIRGLWAYQPDGALYVHLENDEAPARHAWSAVWRRDAAVTIRKATGASVRGVSVQHAFNGIAVTEGARRAVVSDCRVGPWDKLGISVTKDASETLIERNEVFRGSLEDMTPISGSKDWYEIWQVHKLAGFYDRVGISMTLSGRANRIQRNHVYETFDGIDIGIGEAQTLDSPMPDPEHERDAEISENLIERTGDSGMEICGPVVNVRIHHNVLRRTHGGLRYKSPRIGPLFIYRNVLEAGSPFNIWYSMDDSPAEGYVYHNTIVGGTAGLTYSSFNAIRDIGARGWHYVNNLVVSDRGFFAAHDKRMPMNFTADYNVVQGGGRPFEKDIHSRYVADAKLGPAPNFAPLPGSPAIDAGLDLSTYFHGKPLPGCEPDYFKGKAPTVGAFEPLSTAMYDGVSIPVPPREHPRLYLRAGDIPDLQQRVNHPALKAVWASMQAAGKSDTAALVEADAIRYLLTRDEALARRTVARTLELLQNAKFDHTLQDITRPIGRLMVTGAVVYDWCYAVIDAEQRKAYVEQFLRLAKELECRYPPPKAGAVTGHYSEWMLMRDMLSAGIAIYDEYPEMYQLAANRFFGIFAPVRNWWYRGGAFHQGSAYAETRFSSDLYPLWIFERMGAGPVYDPSQRDVPYQWIYMRRPDSQLLRSGDGQGKAPKLRSLLTASYYRDGYILADYLRDPGIDTKSKLFELLWSDPDLKPAPLKDLPLSRYMGSPYGWMVARTGWGEDSVIAEMKVNVFNFNNHQHLDAGAFQVYYKGPLALDSGLYEGAGGGYGSPHDVNYNKRTVAHNSLLVYDPSEAFVRGSRAMLNDGGQRLPNGWREPKSLEDMQANYRTAEVLGQGFGPDPQRPLYTYLKGDLTRAYSGKVREVQRSFVFLNFPDNPVRAALIVFDRVTSSDPGFKKTWLLHAMEQPIVEGRSITVAPTQRGWTGKLVNTVLLPEQAEIMPIGGPGKEFWVAGQNSPNEPKKGGDPAAYELGGWRAEISPVKAAASDAFLNVMQIMDRQTSPLPVKRIEDGPVVGASTAGTTVLFQRDGRRTKDSVAFRSAGGRFLVADLAEGDWQVWREGQLVKSGVRVTAEQGIIWFEGQPGSYKLVCQSGAPMRQ